MINYTYLAKKIIIDTLVCFSLFFENGFDVKNLTVHSLQFLDSIVVSNRCISTIIIIIIIIMIIIIIRRIMIIIIMISMKMTMLAFDVNNKYNTANRH